MDITLQVGESKLRQFSSKSPLSAIAELIWNALDANATHVDVVLERTLSDAIERVVVKDDGDGITPNQAKESFSEFGESWKLKRTHTMGDSRILHGKHGEGRLYALALGDELEWESVANVDGQRYQTRIRNDPARLAVWHLSDPSATSDETGTRVAIRVPQGRTLSALDGTEAISKLTARLAFYLRSYPDVVVTYDGITLDPEKAIKSITRLELDLPEEYQDDQPPPIVNFVEWKEAMNDSKLLACTVEGVALVEVGKPWGQSVVHFTPYLCCARFAGESVEDLHILSMTHADLICAAERAVGEHVAKRRNELAAEIVGHLKSEGNYPYDDTTTDPVEVVERQVFDLVVTAARSALPKKGPARRLQVKLLKNAIESGPTELRKILDSVLSLSSDDRTHLSALLDQTELSSVIAASKTVSDRLNFIGGLRKILADPILREEFREIDQLHPMIADNLWLFGEDWTMTRTEVGLTGVLKAHREILGSEVELEGQLARVTRGDGRGGRVDILMYRIKQGDEASERLVIELKRPTVKVGKSELDQISSYARAIVDNPQYKDVDCRWKFVLVTYDYDKTITRDINRYEGKPGLTDSQPEYEVWVKTWGQLLDDAERKLEFFRGQLNHEASDENVTRYLRSSYAEHIPESLRVGA